MSLSLRPMLAQEFPAVHRLMQQSFPLQEHRSFSDAEALLAKSEYEILVYAEQSEVVGFLAHWKFDDFCFVEHFAVNSASRGSGVGSGIMRAYLAQSTLPVILEVEATDSEIAQRRIGFYQRLGFTLSRVGYIQPCLQGDVSDIPLLLMHAPQDVSQNQLRQAQAEIFRTVYEKDPPDSIQAAEQEIRMRQSPVRVAQIMGIMENGGVEAVVMNYYRAIDRSRIQFDFFVDETSSFPQREEIVRLGGRCFLVPPYSHPLRYIRALIRLFRENRYPVVHSQINTMGVFPLFAAWLARVPVRICHNHSTAHPGEGKKSLMKLLLRPFARLFATDYFACGETAARWMFGNRLFDGGHVSVLPNAIDLARFRFSADDRAAVRAEIGAGNDTLVVGHIGRFMFQKNHAFLLEIFHALLAIRPDSLLLLAGEGELLEETLAQAHQLGIEQQVRFLGVRRDANRLYCAMDVFCLPSFYEGLPVVMVEALASGLGCVVSDQVTRELNAFSVTQLPLESGAAVWAQALANAARSNHAPDAFYAQFDITQTAKRLEAIYLTKTERNRKNH